VTRAVWTVLLAVGLAGRSATLAGQEPTPDDVQRTLRAQPVDATACLAMANRCWDPSVARPLFDCWLAAASRDDVIRQATSASWTVRALTLRALTRTPRTPLDAMRSSRGSVSLIAWSGSPALVRSLVAILSQDVSESPAPDTISPQTARLARDALWDLSERDMTIALKAADQITPLSGRHMSTGRFGESHDLASRDPRAYAARRRAWQWLAAGALAILFAALRRVTTMRRIATAVLVAIPMWVAWFSFQTDVRELPPPQLMFLTASCLAFLTAGLVSGVTASLAMRRWKQMTTAPFVAAVCAFLLCAVTRTAGLFPGSDGSRLMFEPIGSALLAAAAALAISLGLALETSRDASVTSSPEAAAPRS
jgi:hypothetical protein